ncbi:MAG TPA: gluconate 2-dehydrogenase subunit 3 family protein [Deltaproteobacteria bacterium]|nr:gluconate 2-dehydrogenase subunit 3 family protein [Deltaproteobacteria bacterium]
MGSAAGALVLGAWAGWSLSPAPGAQLLSSHELEVVAALAEVMFPAGPFPVDGIEAGVPAEVDRLLAEVLEPIHASGFRGLLHSLEWGTVASRGHRFSRLSPAERLATLQIWSDPSVFVRRVARESFRVVLGMAYFSDPRVLGHMGWRATCGGGPT